LLTNNIIRVGLDGSAVANTGNNTTLSHRGCYGASGAKRCHITNDISTTNCCSFQMRINLASIPPVLKWWCPLLHIQAAKCPSLRRAMGYNALEPSYTIHTFLGGIATAANAFKRLQKQEAY